MPVQIRYSSQGRGNTVPYPPLTDAIRRNYGYVDLRGKPAAVDDVPEAHQSLALRTLLTTLAQPTSPLVPLGCDLGEHTDPASRPETRRRAGGYIQIADARLKDADGGLLQRAASHLEAAFKAGVDTDRWSVNFDLRAVVYEFAERVEAHSVWVWFDAKANTAQKARASRERLVTCLSDAIGAFPSAD